MELVGEQGRVRIETASGSAAAAERLRRLDGVSGVSSVDGSVELLTGDTSAVLAPALRALAEAGVGVSAVTIEEPDLEAVFLHLTGKALRD